MNFCGPCRRRLHIYGQRHWVSDHPSYKLTVGLKQSAKFLSHSFLILKNSDGNNINYLTGLLQEWNDASLSKCFVKNEVLVLTCDPSIPWLFRQTVWMSTMCQALGMKGALMPGAYPQEPVRQHERLDMWRTIPKLLYWNLHHITCSSKI